MPNPFAFLSGNNAGFVPDPLASPATNYLAADATWKPAPTGSSNLQAGADPGGIAITAQTQTATLTVAAGKTGNYVILGSLNSSAGAFGAVLVLVIKINGATVRRVAEVFAGAGGGTGNTNQVSFLSTLNAADVVSLEGLLAGGTTVADANALQIVQVS